MDSDQTDQTPSPTTSVQPTAVVSGAVEPTPKARSSRSKKLLLLAIGILLLLGSSAAAYYGVVVPNKPENVIKRALINTVDETKIKTAAFEGELSLSGDDVPPEFSSFKLQGVAGENGIFSLSASVDKANPQLSLDLLSVDGNSLFLRFSGLSGQDKILNSLSGEESLSLNLFVPILAQLNDQWFEIDQSTFSQFGSQLNITSTKLDKADAKKIGDVYKRYPFIKVIKVFPDEAVHDMNSHHYQIGVDKAKLKAFLTDLKEQKIKNLELSQDDIDAVDRFDDSGMTVEIWVAKGSKAVDQIAASWDKNGTSGRLRLALYDFNKPIQLEKPAGAKSLRELFNGLFNSPMSEGELFNQSDDLRPPVYDY